MCARQHAMPMVGYAWIRGQTNKARAGHANPPYELRRKPGAPARGVGERRSRSQLR
jgi:hypothetical protein